MGRWEPPVESAQLTEDQRRILDALIRNLTEGAHR